MEDRELAGAATRGDERAFTTIVKRHERYLYGVAYRILLNAEDALDAVQNALLQAARKIGDYNGSGSLRGWLAAITARKALDCRRHGAAEIPMDPEKVAALADRCEAEGSGGAREALEDQERRRCVAAAMESLSPQQRAIMALRLGEGMGPKEIAERLGLPATQVRSQLVRAVVRVREIVARDGE